MPIKIARITLVVVFLFVLNLGGRIANAQEVASGAQSKEAVNALRVWLKDQKALELAVESQAFAKVPLTKDDATEAKKALAEYRLGKLKKQRAKEVEERQITLGDKQMKFDIKKFGERPSNGWSLFISMHGGGGAPARVNDAQWRNQKVLYQPKEGLYVAPRAPTNTWNLWHEPHVDKMFDRLIENLVAIEGVNWNRVYLMGYSAGGDGVYQLAPRMADRWAAAAMMAGHPNGVTPHGLRNLPFALFMGGKDAAYKRNEIAERWKKKLADLQKQDPDGYTHFVKIFPQYGHWMNREDAIAVPWMAKHTRNPMPRKIVWKQSGLKYPQSYWLGVEPADQKKGSLITAEVEGQTISIASDDVDQVIVLLTDQLVDLEQPITIVSGSNTLFQGKVQRTVQTLVETINARHDPNLCFASRVKVRLRDQ